MAKDTTLLVATVKNEGPNILEWVAHHRLCGFDRIQIYQHDSSDATVQTLRNLDRIGAIEFHAKAVSPARAYRLAAQSEAFRETTWCMTLGGDEFLNVATGDRKVGDLISACPATDAILVNRRLFGCDGAWDMSGQLVSERFARAEPAGSIRRGSMVPFKALFRNKAYAQPAGHLPQEPVSDDNRICNASGLTEDEFERDETHSLDPGGRRLAQVNHYALRDLPSFLLKLTDGGTHAPDLEAALRHWRRHDRIEEEDTSLATRAFEIWAEMKRLDALADGKLLRLRQRSQRQWRLQLEACLQMPEIAELSSTIRSETPMQSIFRLPGQATPVFSSVRQRREDNTLILRETGSG